MNSYKPNTMKNLIKKLFFRAPKEYEVTWYRCECGYWTDIYNPGFPWVESKTVMQKEPNTLSK